MKLTGLDTERGARSYHRFVAIWRLPNGVIRQTLPLTIEHDTRGAALLYAEKNPPRWQS